MKDVLFFEESIQAIYNYFKDVPSWVVNCFFLLATADGWTTFTIFFFFLHLWIRPVLDLSLEQADGKTLFVTHHNKDRCSVYVLGYLSHFRMRLSIYNHILSQIWRLY